MRLFSVLTKIHCQVPKLFDSYNVSIYIMRLTANAPHVPYPSEDTEKYLENKNEMSVPKALHAHILFLISLE